jgi:hypothetical protein
MLITNYDRPITVGDTIQVDGHQWIARRFGEGKAYTSGTGLYHTWAEWIRKNATEPSFRVNDLHSRVEGAGGVSDRPVIAYLGPVPTWRLAAGTDGIKVGDVYHAAPGQFLQAVRPSKGLRCRAYWQSDEKAAATSWAGFVTYDGRAKPNPVQPDGAWNEMSEFRDTYVCVVSMSEPPVGVDTLKVGDEIPVEAALKRPGLLVTPVGFGFTGRFRVLSGGTWQPENRATGNITKPTGSELRQLVRVVQLDQPAAEAQAAATFVEAVVGQPTVRIVDPGPNDFFQRYQVVPGKPEPRPPAVPGVADRTKHPNAVVRGSEMRPGEMGAPFGMRDSAVKAADRPLHRWSTLLVAPVPDRFEDSWFAVWREPPPMAAADREKLYEGMTAFTVAFGLAMSVAGAGYDRGYSGRRTVPAGSEYARLAPAKLPVFLQPNVRSAALVEMSKWDGALNAYRARHGFGLYGGKSPLDRYLDAIGAAAR